MIYNPGPALNKKARSKAGLEFNGYFKEIRKN